jgi:hypothetical protein
MIPSFVFDLVRERLVDYKMYLSANGNTAKSSDESIEQGFAALNEFYCEVFNRFNAFWVASNPKDTMAFPQIFEKLKTTIRQQLVQNSFKY